MGLDYDVLSDCTDDRTPGNETDVYLACTCDVIAPFPDFVGTTLQGDSVKIVDDILLDTGKQWRKIRVISDSGEVKYDQVGNEPSTSYVQTFSAKTVTDENYDEFFNNNRNGCFLAIVVQKDGKQRLIGHPTKGHAKLKNCKGTNGMNAESNAEWSFDIVASPGFIPPYYSGDIDVAP